MARSNALTVAIAALVVGSVVGAGFATAMIGPSAPGTVSSPSGTDTPTGPDPTDTNRSGPGVDLSGSNAQLVSFSSPAEYSEYVRAGQRLDYAYMGSSGAVREVERGGDGGDGGDAGAPQSTSTPAPTMTPTAADSVEDGEDPLRVAGTNVQVATLDEPDVVKTDGRHFYYVPQQYRHAEPRPTDDPSADGVKPRRPGTHVIDAGTPADPQAIAEIDARGRMLQTGDTLVVIQHDRLVGFDVSEPSAPEQTWEHELEAGVVTARERNGTVYLVTRTRASPGVPCPVEPLGGAASIACGDVFHPRTQIQVESTYSALSLSAATGEVADAVSFVGSGHNTVVYMNNDGLYVTYTKSAGRASLLGDYALSEIDGLPTSVEDRIQEIRSYDISPSSTQREIVAALQGWLESLPEDERRDRERELSDGFREFVADHQRNLTKTGIVRIGVDGTELGVQTVGTVPGHPLNQFSISVHDGTLRITTTIPAAGSAESVNDLYTLDAESLEQLGAAKGMGENERVYSVRYVGDKAYVVTFRRIDPFHVIDLSDPSDPTVQGELKLPGFSSYLHPVANDRILGIGEEDGEVKAVLFDVSDPTDPTIADSMKLDAGWSAISQSHHAFMQDRKHGVVFLPTGESGMVVSYTDDDLDVVTRVDTDAPARRARYVEDMLYIFAGPEVVVVDETTWERTTTLELGD